jgi:cell division protein FtsN
VPVDYADRGRPKRKKPTRKGKPPGNRKHSKQPRVAPIRVVKILLLAALIVGLFVAGLWWLQGTQQQGPEPGTIFGSDLDGDAPSQQALDELPQAPQERWRYIEELENREVEVIVPERAESRRRLMQCGSFRRERDAEELRARIAMQGMESQIRRSHSEQHGTWFRVILGPFENLRAAQAANNQLRQGGVHGCQIWLWNLD